NIILKMYEGVASALMANIKGIFTQNAFTKLSAIAVKSGLKDLKKRMDYTEFGGAPLLGVNGVVIKAHGSSDAKAIMNAIKQAKLFVRRDVVKSIRESL
ncbi:MAG TPA: phosphate--acyl-ACP acyltransferase, partial [Clostridiales bacterium]|nr:phosphate--acyl-ACP acyltransferase [Clostridiales bacterium]